jgi:DNA polymerase-3 subunit delta
MTFEQIIGDLKKKIYHPVYFLSGEEPFYIDQLTDFFESNILSDSEKEFNQSVLYGKDLDIYSLISFARRYPMMSSHQVIIVREAQDMKSLFPREKTKEKEDKNKDDKNPFAEYLQKPTTSTILVFCYKYKKVDKRTKIAKLLDKHSIVYEAKKVYENQLPGWINSFVKSKGFRIDDKSCVMLADNLGNDLTKIANEINKLTLNIKPGSQITPDIIEDNIGLSKDFNIFELIKAIGERNTFKSFRIVNYFAANPKSNPMVLSTAQLYSYFLKILTYHQLDDRSSNNAASVLGVSTYFVNDYANASRAYPVNHCIRNISYIRDYDMRSKGVNNVSSDDGELMKELIYKILN